MYRTVKFILALSLLCSFGCDSSKPPLELPRYTILKSGDPNELPVQPKDSPYWLMISPCEKGHEVLVLPSGSGDVQRFRSKRIRFWIEGDEVKVEVLEQGVIDAGEAIAGRSQPASEAPPDDDNPPPIKGKIQIRFPKQTLSFTLAEVAQGVTFKYEIVVAEDIENVTPEAQDTGQAAGPGPSGLYPFESISGNGQSYSLHDIGLGPGVFKSSTIKKGKYELSFEWDGRNWTGPSDYGHPKGDPFPAGDYTLQVRLAGRVKSSSGDEPYEIKESVQVMLTE